MSDGILGTEIAAAVRSRLTQRQTMVLDFIVEHTAARGYPPSLREIGSHMGITSTNGVNDHLRALERKGAIVRADLKSRGIRVLRGHPVDPGDVEAMQAENARLRDLLRSLYRAAEERSGWKLDQARAAISKEFAANGVEL